MHNTWRIHMSRYMRTPPVRDTTRHAYRGMKKANAMRCRVHAPICRTRPSVATVRGRSQSTVHLSSCSAVSPAASICAASAFHCPPSSCSRPPGTCSPSAWRSAVLKASRDQYLMQNMIRTALIVQPGHARATRSRSVDPCEGQHTHTHTRSVHKPGPYWPSIQHSHIMHSHFPQLRVVAVPVLA